MKNNVLVLGAGSFQRGLILQLKREGYKVHVISNRSNDVAVKDADVFHHLDYTRQEEIWKIFKNTRALQVFSSASDVAIETEAFIRERAGLKGYDSAFIRRFTDKWNYKSKLLQMGLDGIPQTAVCKSYQELLNFLQDHRQSGIILKPRKGSGSKSVVHIKDESGLKAFEWEKRPADYLVEKYIEGQEYGGDFFVKDGQIEFYFPTLKKVNKYQVPIAHLLLGPTKEASNIYPFLNELCLKMPLQDGIYNVDIIVFENQPYLIDLAPRIGGNGIADITHKSTGYNEYKLLADWLIKGQLTHNPIYQRKPYGVYILGADESGKVESLNDNFLHSEKIVCTFFKVGVGDEVEAFYQGANHLGYVIYTADTDDELIELQEKIEGFQWLGIRKNAKVNLSQ